jgi:HEPN domain-containing protein
VLARTSGVLTVPEACFQAQQAGEKALNAYLYARGFTSIVTHSLRRLLRECEALDPAFSELGEAGRLLDQHYIATRIRTAWTTKCLPPALRAR